MPLRAPVTHVVWDMDGVLLDTERLYTQATREIVARYGREYDWTLKSQMMGRRAIEAARLLVERLDLPLAPEEYLRESWAVLERLMPTANAMPGAQELTAALAARGVPQVVASSSPRHLFDLKTISHRAWFASFDAIILGDDPRVVHGKPAPDIFLLAASTLGVSPGCCVVIEDAPAGVAAARAAGMQVIAVPDPALDRALFAGADLVLDTLAGVPVSTFGV